jgi:hypothetical protein
MTHHSAWQTPKRACFPLQCRAGGGGAAAPVLGAVASPRRVQRSRRRHVAGGAHAAASRMRAVGAAFTAHATSLSRLHCPTAPELSAAQRTTRAAPPVTTQTAGWTSAMRGWRAPVDGAPSTIIMRFMERRRRACVCCQSLGEQEVRRSTVLRRSTAYFVAPPPGPCSAQAALRASGASTCSRCSNDHQFARERATRPTPPR